MERVTGVDVVRGLAVLGMFTAHVGAGGEDFWSGTGWLQVADGRSAASFALLAGVSAALLSGGREPVSGPALRRARARILVRAVLLWPLGIVMIALGTPIAVILPGYAVMFALTAGAVGWSRRALLLTAAAAAVIGPLVLHVVASAGGGEPPSGLPQVVSVLVGHYYPAVVWMAYLLVGIAVGRLDLRQGRTARALAVVGVASALVGYGGAALVVRGLGPEQVTARALLTSAPHSSTTPEVVGNIGVTLAVLALCLTVARLAPRLVVPVAATGALALTAYCGHLVAIAALGDDAVWDPSNARLVVFVVVTLVLTTVWRALLGRGPLERLVHEVSTRIADSLVPRTPVPTPPETVRGAEASGVPAPPR